MGGRGLRRLRRTLGSGFRGGLATLAVALPTATVGGQEPSAAPAPGRVRPLLEQARTERDLDALAERLDEWSEAGNGLDPVDPELALASVIALVRLIYEPSRAEELRYVLESCAIALEESPDPNIALALAEGWIALNTTPFVASIDLQERERAVANALRAAERIDPADGRDAFGCDLARILYYVRLQAGEGNASEVLEDALRTFPSAPASRAWVLAALTEDRRVVSDWERAWSALEEARAIVAGLGESADANLRRAVGSAGCHLELAAGLPDEALDTLGAKPEATDSEGRYSDLLDSAAIVMSILRPRYMKAVEEKIEKALEAPGELPARPGVEATLRARLALIALQREEIEAPARFAAESALKAAFEDESLDSTTRTSLALRGAARSLALGDHDRAASWLARADELADGFPMQTELREASIAYHAQVAMRPEAPPEELAPHARSVAKAWNELLARLSGAPQRRGGLGWLAWRNRRAVFGTQVELQLLGANGAERALEVGMREEETGSLAQRMSAARDDLSGDLSDARELLLRPRVGLLVYLPGSEGALRIFLVEREGPVLVDSIPWTYDLEQRPRDLVALLSRSPAGLEPADARASRQTIDELAKDLGSSLLPVAVAERLVNLDEVYVVGSGLLGDVPFDHVWLGDGPIGLRLAVSHLPSLRVGMALARRARAEKGGARDLLLVTAPEVHASLRESLGTFALSESDQKRLTRGFAKSGVLTGEAATLGGVLGALQRTAPAFLHLMVHGDSDFRREQTGALVLAPEGGSDGRVWCDDLLEREFRSPPLVALSACHSARGPQRVGDDGLAQLGGVLFLRGARCVVESTSDIALAPAIDLMETFGRAVAAGRSPARAMLEARRALVDEQTYAHPFYALSLRVVGLGSEPVVRAASEK